MSSQASATILEREIIPYLAISLQQAFRQLPPETKAGLQEIRLRLGRPVMLVLDSGDGWLCADKKNLSRAEMEQTIQFLTESSLYAREEELRQGYITIPGGHRIGLTGKAVLQDGRIRSLKQIGGLNIRLARQVIGAADKVLPYLLEGNSFVSTLLVSPPGCGKTTVLRDLVRQLSIGIPKYNVKGQKIAVVDERSEIAACYLGLPQNDVGPRTDILDGARKAEGIMLVLRSMSPQIIATDEVGSPDDIWALAEALVCGVRLIATAHGQGCQDLQQRPVLRELVNKGLFGRIVVLGSGKHPGTIAAVLNGQSLKPILGKVVSGGMTNGYDP